MKDMISWEKLTALICVILVPIAYLVLPGAWAIAPAVAGLVIALSKRLPANRNHRLLALNRLQAFASDEAKAWSTKLIQIQVWDKISPESDEKFWSRPGLRLLLTGPPGSGCTTALLATASRVATAASKDESIPIPAYLRLSHWKSQREPFHAWLLSEGAALCHAPESVFERWLEDGRIMLLLDDLEVLNENRRKELFDFLWKRPITPAWMTYSHSTNEQPELSGSLMTTVRTIKLGPPSHDVASKILGCDPCDCSLSDWARSPSLISMAIRTSRLVEDGRRPCQLLRSAEHAEDFRKRAVGTALRTGQPGPQLTNTICWIARNIKEHDKRSFMLSDLKRSWLPNRSSATVVAALATFIGLFLGGYGAVNRIVRSSSRTVMGDLRAEIKGLSFQVGELDFNVGATMLLMLVALGLPLAFNIISSRMSWLRGSEVTYPALGFDFKRGGSLLLAIALAILDGILAVPILNVLLAPAGSTGPQTITQAIFGAWDVVELGALGGWAEVYGDKEKSFTRESWICLVALMVACTVLVQNVVKVQTRATAFDLREGVAKISFSNALRMFGIVSFFALIFSTAFTWIFHLGHPGFSLLWLFSEAFALSAFMHCGGLFVIEYLLVRFLLERDSVLPRETADLRGNPLYGFFFRRTIWGDSFRWRPIEDLFATNSAENLEDQLS